MRIVMNERKGGLWKPLYVLIRGPLYECLQDRILYSIQMQIKYSLYYHPQIYNVNYKVLLQNRVEGVL